MQRMLDRITKTMEEKGITQRELTQKLGIAESAFGGWRRGVTSSYRSYLPEIATILGVTTDYLAFGTKTENEEFFSPLGGNGARDPGSGSDDPASQPKQRDERLPR